MAGQIIQKGERKWLVRVFFGRNPDTGKRRYHGHQINGNKKDAQRYLNGVLREMDMGTFVEPSAMTVSEFLNQWLQTAAKQRLRQRTFDDYEDLLNRYVRDAIGGMKLCEVRPLDVQAVYSKMLEKGLS